jgi:lauroyl/myristoyl acyltransferase
VLARTAFKQDRTTNFALSKERLIKAVSRLPYPLVHRLLVAGIRAETWLRYPLLTLNAKDSFDETFDALDPNGTRLGLTKSVRESYERNALYNEMADLVTLLMYMDDARFRKRALRFENEDVLLREIESGPGAIVAGFRIGAYAALPWVLGTLSPSVLMIVGDERFARMAQELGEAFIPNSARALTFLRAKEPLVLSRSQAMLKGGGVVSTLVDTSPIKYEKTTEVKLFDGTIEAAYGIPYLSAVTGRSIVPAVLTRAKGPRFTLRFDEPIEAPARDSQSVREGAQRLYGSLEKLVRRFPDQWVGWTTLKSQMDEQSGSQQGEVARPLV